MPHRLCSLCARPIGPKDHAVALAVPRESFWVAGSEFAFHAAGTPEPEADHWLCASCLRDPPQLREVTLCVVPHDEVGPGFTGAKIALCRTCLSRAEERYQQGARERAEAKAQEDRERNRAPDVNEWIDLLEDAPLFASALEKEQVTWAVREWIDLAGRREERPVAQRVPWLAGRSCLFCGVDAYAVSTIVECAREQDAVFRTDDSVSPPRTVKVEFRYFPLLTHSEFLDREDPRDLSESTLVCKACIRHAARTLQRRWTSRPSPDRVVELAGRVVADVAKPLRRGALRAALDSLHRPGASLQVVGKGKCVLHGPVSAGVKLVANEGGALCERCIREADAAVSALEVNL